MRYYLQILQEAFAAGEAQPVDDALSKPTFAELRNLPLHKTFTGTQWAEYDFSSFHKRCNAPKPDSVRSRESYGRVAAEAEELFEDLRAFCTRDCRQQDSHIKGLIKKAYDFQYDVRGRAALQACFEGTFPRARKTMKAAAVRRALLFMCRVYAAINTFVKAASSISSFRNITMTPVMWNNRVVRKPSAPRPLLEVLRPACPGLTSLPRLKNITNGYIERRFDSERRKVRHVHAEVQLLYEFEMRRTTAGHKPRVHPYIGCSKRCCYLCGRLLQHHAFFHARDSHNKLYTQWRVPQLFPSRTAAGAFEQATRAVFEEVRAGLVLHLSGEDVPSRGSLRPESTVALSTAATLSQPEGDNLSLRPMNSFRG